MDPLIVDITELHKSVGSEIRVKKEIEPALLKERREELDFTGPVEIDVVLRNVGEEILAEGRAEGQLQLECNRCLCAYRTDFCLDIKESFCIPDQCENGEEAFEIRENKVDLFALVNQGLMLWLPIKQVCRIDCKGLCPKCGKNLNEEDCNCMEDKIDPRMRVLKDYFDK